MSDQARAELARQVVATLPRYGSWANSFRDFDTPFGKVGFRQLAILWIVRYGMIPEDALSPSRLAEFSKVQPSVVTRALDKLEAGGFIVRSTDPDDRRRLRLSMTEKGREVSEFVERLYIDDIVASMAFLSNGEIDELARNVVILGRIIEDLERRRLARTIRSDGSPR